MCISFGSAQDRSTIKPNSIRGYGVSGGGALRDKGMWPNRKRASGCGRPKLREICRRLDGIPLAIELAATQIGATTPARLLEMLPGRFEVLAYGCRKTPARQQTLQATLDWGYRLLSDRETIFVRALSVFAGSFD